MTTASDLIAASAVQGTIVLDDYTPERAADLLSACDGSTDANDGITEYWGTDEDGDEWRVHLEVGDVTYRIETRPADSRDHRDWTTDGLGDPNDGNRFESREEAERCIATLRTYGDDWAEASYRVVPS